MKKRKNRNQNATKIGIKIPLKTIEPHILKTLIYEDVKRHPNSRISDICTRVKDVDIRDVRKILYAGVQTGVLTPAGSRTNRTYTINQ